MKKPIIEPEFILAETRFALSYEQWQSLESTLAAMGCQVIPSSRQYLEDCELQRTDLIAIKGLLLFKEMRFPFTAQLDANGFALYVGALSGERITPVSCDFRPIA